MSTSLALRSIVYLLRAVSPAFDTMFVRKGWILLMYYLISDAIPTICQACTLVFGFIRRREEKQRQSARIFSDISKYEEEAELGKPEVLLS